MLPTDVDEQSMLENTLSADQVKVIADIMICGSSAQIFVMNLMCLRSNEYLNSETINAYVLIAKRGRVSSSHSGKQEKFLNYLHWDDISGAMVLSSF